MSTTQKGLEEALLEKSKENIELQAKMDDMSKKLKNAQTTISKMKKENPEIESLPMPVQTTGEVVEEEAASDETHLIEGWSPKFCPDKRCKKAQGIIDPTERKERHRNKAFKDETKCTNCGLHLGEEENVRKNLEFCPNCGESAYERVR